MQHLQPASSSVQELNDGFLSLTCASIPARSAPADVPRSLQPPYGISTCHPLKDGLDKLHPASSERKEPTGPRLSVRATQGPDAGPLIERCVDHRWLRLRAI